jgi:hypothetical protein
MMMRKTRGLVRFGLTIAMGSALLAGGARAQTAPNSGPGMMMNGRMMGPGMMMGSGMMMPNGCPHCGMMWGQQRANLNLSVADVKANLEQWLKWQGNSRLKLGQVAERDADTITAEIVTTDRSVLVERYAINRHTGFYRPE